MLHDFLAQYGAGAFAIGVAMFAGWQIVSAVRRAL